MFGSAITEFAFARMRTRATMLKASINRLLAELHSDAATIKGLAGGANSAAQQLRKASETGAKVTSEPGEPGTDALLTYLKGGERTEESTQAAAESALAALRASGLPLGWSNDPRKVNAHPFAPWPKESAGASRQRAASLAPALCTIGAFVSKLLGLLATATGVSFGAPFWFDLLSRVTNLRGTGPKPGEKKK